MARIQSLRSERAHPKQTAADGVEEAAPQRGPRVAPRAGLHVARADVHIDTPSHTPGTQKGEEVILRSPEKGRRGHAREARSSTSIGAARRAPIDPRMPHLPPA